jgi:hypothetical protein
LTTLISDDCLIYLTERDGRLKRSIQTVANGGFVDSRQSPNGQNQAFSQLVETCDAARSRKRPLTLTVRAA